MASPPSYRSTNHNPAFNSSQEELAALQRYAHDKLYVTPGTNGTLPAMDRGGYGLASLVWGGPMETGPGPDPLIPDQTRAERMSALEEVDRKRKEKEAKVQRKGTLRKMVKSLVKGHKSGKNEAEKGEEIVR